MVFGGRCDFAAKKYNYQQIFSDVWVLFLENLTWYEAKLTGSIPRERFAHSAAITGTTMIIYGGLNNENFCSTELYCLELDPYHSKRAEDKRKCKKNAVEEYTREEMSSSDGL